MTNRRRFTLLDAIDDPQLFARWFRDKASWAAWFTFLRALFGLPLLPEQLALFHECTGRTEPPTAPATEGWLICGRRAGKSFVLALVAVYLAAFHSYRQYLAPGERGVVLVVASDRKQARVIFRYVRALLLGVPMLRKLVERETAEAFDLNNGTSIEIMAASYRSLRGYTVIAALLDELAFWPTDDSANPDTEIIAAIRPAMSTIPNAMLLCASSPYAQRGALFDAFKRHYAKDSPVLVWRAPTRTMNPTVPQSVVDAAMEADPQSAAAEYLAQYRIDVQLFVSRDAIEAAVIAGRFELPRVEGIRYHAFVDPSGGSSDSMTLCVAHISGQPRRRRSDPRALCSVLARRLRQRIFGRAPQPRRRPDRRRPLRRRVAARGLPQARRRLSRRRQDEVRSLSCPAAAAEQRPRRIARQQAPRRSALRPGATDVAGIDHVPGGHDDVANAVAGATVLTIEAAAQPRVPIVSPAFYSRQMGWVGSGAENKTATQLFYESGYGRGGGSPWPGSDPFGREW